LAVVLAIYNKCRTTPIWALVLLCLSKRIHSIYSLRLFNDSWAMLFLYAAVLALLYRRLNLAVVLFSLGVSIKMNVLLFLPGLALVLAKEDGIVKNVPRALLFLGIQVLVGWPFIEHNWQTYLKGSFDLGRVFMHTWTVNLKFLPEDIFVGKELALGLLVCHFVMLLVFLRTKWYGNGFGFFSRRHPSFSPDHIVAILFECNFIGIVFARSLHFQFYTWYFHTIPFLLWHTQYVTWLRLLLWLGIAYVWDTFPSTSFTSLLLLACHLCLLLGLILSPAPHYYNRPPKAQRVRPAGARGKSLLNNKVM